MAVGGTCLCCKRRLSNRFQAQSRPIPSPASALSCFFFGFHCSGCSDRARSRAPSFSSVRSGIAAALLLLCTTAPLRPPSKSAPARPLFSAAVPW